MTSKTILLVDDDAQALESTKKILEHEGYRVQGAKDGEEALGFVRSSSFDVIVSDVRMPRLGGMEFLRALSLCGEKTPVILMTAFGRVEDAVWAMKLGAVDFLTKPFKRQTLLAAVAAVLKRVSGVSSKQVCGSLRQNENAENLLGQSNLVGHSSLIGQSEAIAGLRALIAQVAPTSATVLIRGESGSGKELVARSLHQSSARFKARFVALNCAAIPENLIESELFGHEKGAFTGATVSKEGLFEAAHGGTLFLDEIGDMPLALQAKLLRVLQEREVVRLGSTKQKSVDVRVIAATHQDLAENVKLGKFRHDLLYRLEVVTIGIPPLRERVDDVPILCMHFLNECNIRHSKNLEGFSDEAFAVLQAHVWPGNVRELFNAIERAVVFCGGSQIQSSDLSPHLLELFSTSKPLPLPPSKTVSFKIGTPLQQIEDEMIRKTLEATDGDKSMTAKLLGINSRTIYRKLEKR